jgi:phosphoserine phosphatase
MEDAKEISKLRTELNELDKVKEDFFSKSKENREKIKNLMISIRKLKQDRNNLTSQVKINKAQRDKFNKELTEKINAYKKIAPKVDKNAPKVNVQFLKKEIQAMEYKIETEGLKFNKEQELMKVIKDKQKQLKAASPQDNPELRELSKVIDEIRTKADAAHKITKEKADASQKKHEELIAALKQIKELDVVQRELNIKCTEFKDKVKVINEQLNGKLEHVVAEAKEHPRPQRIERPVENNRREYRKDNKKHEENSHKIIDLQNKVEEKIKKGQKLTTEDLLAFQSKR